MIARVKAVNLKSGEVEVFSNEECRFGYRESLFKRHPHYAIASVTFRLSKSFTYREKYTDLNRELEGIPNPTLTQVREAVIRTRTRKLPDYHVLPNAGSFFKNPLLTREEKEELQKILPDAPIYNTGGGRFKTSAAYLIDKAGFKGQRRGQVGTYERHSLVVVNHGTEEGREIVSFAREIQQEVKKRFGVTLNRKYRYFSFKQSKQDGIVYHRRRAQPARHHRATRSQKRSAPGDLRHPAHQRGGDYRKRPRYPGREQPHHAAGDDGGRGEAAKRGVLLVQGGDN